MPRDVATSLTTPVSRRCDEALAAQNAIVAALMIPLAMQEGRICIVVTILVGLD
jgi:hypothetical protein